MNIKPQPNKKFKRKNVSRLNKYLGDVKKKKKPSTDDQMTEDPSMPERRDTRAANYDA